MGGGGSRPVDNSHLVAIEATKQAQIRADADKAIAANKLEARQWRATVDGFVAYMGAVTEMHKSLIDAEAKKVEALGFMLNSLGDRTVAVAGLFLDAMKLEDESRRNAAVKLIEGLLNNWEKQSQEIMALLKPLVSADRARLVEDLAKQVAADMKELVAKVK